MDRRKPIILIAGELGAGCTEVGELVSRKLGLEIYNTERFIRSIASSPHLSFSVLVEKSRSGEVDVDKILQGMVLDIINNGPAIIEGRSALFGLGHQVDLKVFLYGDLEGRLKHISERRKEEDLKQIEKDIEVSDIDRKSLVGRLFNRDWMDPLLYDIMLNTSRVTYEEAASIIIGLLEKER